MGSNRAYMFVVVSSLLLVMVILFLFNSYVSGFTGFTVFSLEQGAISFLAPTPQNGSVINAPWMVVNVSSNNNISLAVLSWGSQNLTMIHDAQTAWIQVTGSGLIRFVVYSMNASGDSSVSEERWVKIGYVNWTPVAEQLVQEDTAFNLDLWPLLYSTKNKSALGFSVLQDRSDRMSCGLSASRFLNCTPMPDAVGPTLLTITADDQAVSASFSINGSRHFSIRHSAG